MNTNYKLTFLAAAACAVLLTACGGGGGDIDDGQTPLRTEGQSVTLQSPTSSCPPAAGVTVYVFGGVAPYTLRNTVPDLVALSTSSIGSAGEGVHIDFKGGCLVNVPVVVVDKDGTTVNISLTYTATAS